MNQEQGYKTFFHFLNHLWEMDKERFKDTLPSLLGDMQLVIDGVPKDAGLRHWKISHNSLSIDPAMWSDWQVAWNEINDMKSNIDSATVYQTGRQFIANYNALYPADVIDTEITFLLENWHREKFKILWSQMSTV